MQCNLNYYTLKHVVYLLKYTIFVENFSLIFTPAQVYLLLTVKISDIYDMKVISQVARNPTTDYLMLQLNIHAS